MKKITGILCLTLVVMMIAAAVPIRAEAGGSVPPTRDTNTDGTNMYVMGDCRVKAIFDVCDLPGAAIAQGAGHYRGLWSTGYVIDTASQMSLMKSAVIANLKKKGKATVIIMASINVGSHATGDCGPAVIGQLKPAKTATKWHAKYKGKTVYPTVCCTSLVPKQGVSPAAYNNCLKSYLRKKAYRKIKYVTVSAGSGYTADGYHLTFAGARSIWNSMHAADGHIWGKAKIKKKATLSKNGSYTLKCRICGKTKKVAIPSVRTCKLKKAEYTYDGQAVKPAVVVKDRKGKAVAKKYYTVTYSHNSEPGTGTVKITFKGRYQGSKKLSFTIAEPAAEENGSPAEE